MVSDPYFFWCEYKYRAVTLRGSDCVRIELACSRYITAPQHLVCRAVQSLHINRMQTGIIEVFICRRMHMNTSMILICIWLICRLCTALHTKCCGAVYGVAVARGPYPWSSREDMATDPGPLRHHTGPCR